MSNNSAASIRAQLLNIAKAEGTDFNTILVRYALKRILYRSSQRFTHIEPSNLAVPG